MLFLRICLDIVQYNVITHGPQTLKSFSTMLTHVMNIFTFSLKSEHYANRYRVTQNRY